MGANVSEEAFKSLPAFPVESAASPEERPVGLVEIAGRVKWFDVSKGYGFIVPDSGEGDVLIHVTVLRRDGFQTIYEGARVVAEAQRRDKGMQVFRVLSVTAGRGRASVAIAADAAAGAGDQCRRLRDRRRQMVQPRARLRLPDPRRGHRGHLRPYGDARRYGFADPQPGDTMLARFGPGPKGLLAAEVRPLDGGRGHSSH